MSNVQINHSGETVLKRSALQPEVGHKKHKTSHDSKQQSSGQSVSIEDDPQDALSHIDNSDLRDEIEDDRFFGGGLTEEQTQALDFLDAHDRDEYQPAMALDITGVRKLAVKFERAITKNQKLRARFGHDPTKFLDSEAELDSEIKSLSVLSEYPNLYREFVDMGCLNSLVSLIGHENTDIVCDVIQVIEDLTDEETNASTEEVKTMVEGLRAAQAFESLTQNLARLDETVNLEREGVYKTLSIMENAVTMESSNKYHLFHDAKIHTWLLTRIQKEESSDSMSEIKQYAAELLSVLIQESAENISELVEADCIDCILLLLAPYRKHEPQRGSLDEEFLENCFDILSTLVTISDGKDKFIEGEGVELMQRLLIDAKYPNTRFRALQVIEYACGSWSGGAVCARVIDTGLLGTLFSLFTKKEDLPTLQTCLGIFNSFFRTLSDGEPERIRVINKFVEKHFQKLRRLFELRVKFQRKHDMFLAKVETKAAEQNNLTDDEMVALDLTNYLDRMENGLSGLQLVDTILAWLIASEESVRSFVLSNNDEKFLLSAQGTLKEMLENLGGHVKAGTENHEEIQDLEYREEYDMIEALLDALKNI